MENYQIRENVIDMMFEYTKHIINASIDEDVSENKLLPIQEDYYNKVMDKVDKHFLWNTDPYFRRIVETITNFIISEKEQTNG